MPLTLRAISLDKILKQAFSIYGEHFVMFLGISAIPNLALLALHFGLEKFPVMRPHAPGWIGLLAGLGVSFASLFASSIVTAATTVAVSDIYLDRTPDLWDCFSRLSGKAFRIAYVAFLVEIVVAVGFLFCLIPGIYWAGVYGIAIPAVVMENISAFQSLKRSEYLTTDSVARIVIAFFMTAAFTGALVLMLRAGAAALGLTPHPYGNIPSERVLTLITTTIGGILFGPISAIALALEYFDQRVRKEAFDINQMMMAGPEDLVTGAAAL
jgi:hypothetical protein